MYEMDTMHFGQKLYKKEWGVELPGKSPLFKLCRGPGRNNKSGVMVIVEPRYNDLRYNDIPDITMKVLCPGKSYSKMYGTKPRYNDLRYNNNPDITVWIWRSKYKIVPDITILLVFSLQSTNKRHQQQGFMELR